MPTAPKAGDRLRMEEEFSPELLEALRVHCRAWRVPRDRWHLAPMVARTWEVTAVQLLAAKIEKSQGIGHTSAAEAAASYLDLEPNTHHSRLKRARWDVLKAA